MTTTGAPTAIWADGLSRRFPSGVALDGLDLRVERGEVLALLGPNGAGKTTTIRLLNGVLRPDRGRSLVAGLDPVAQGDRVRALTGVLTENAGLDERLTPVENLRFVARVRGLGHRADARIDELLERFGMADRRSTTVQGMSTGQRKRLALAAALLHEPEVLFLDEPTSGLDPAASRDVLDLIARLAGRQGRTVVLCTHLLGEAGQLADRIAILQRGRLQAFGRPAELAQARWPGLRLELDLGHHPGDDLAAAAAHRPGVLAASAVDQGLAVRVADRESVPPLVAWLVGRELPVYAATPRPATLEELYFAIQHAEADAAPAPAAPPGQGLQDAETDGEGMVT